MSENCGCECGCFIPTEKPHGCQGLCDNCAGHSPDFNEYQAYVNRVCDGYELEDMMMAGTKAISQELAYNIVGMSGEAGEALEKLKKAWRNVGVDNVYEPLSKPEARHGLALEIGDVLYYAARVANLLGYELSEIADMHVEKLNGRIERGTVKGEGDYR